MFQLANLLKSPIRWLNPTGDLHDCVISSRIRLARNISSIPFPHAGSPKELTQISERICGAAKKIRALAKAAYVRLADLSNVDQRYLVERHLISEDFLRESSGRCVIIGEKELVSLMVNEEDHLRLQVLSGGLTLMEALAQALSLDGELAKELPYAFHKEFGFLASCPTNVGTGLRASCLVHLPGLVHSQAIGPMLQELARLGLVARGFYGEGSKVYGDLFQISNATTLGKSEQEFVEAIGVIVNNVCAHERQSREKLLKGASKLKILDRMWRAYAVLNYSKLISFEEAMQELSWIRLGLGLGLKFDHVVLARINELMVLTQPAHIQMFAGRELGPRERDSVRADLINKIVNFKK